jgi:hypothetical protein
MALAAASTPDMTATRPSISNRTKRCIAILLGYFDSSLPRSLEFYIAACHLAIGFGNGLPG